jgi:hypothetical protein
MVGSVPRFYSIQVFSQCKGAKNGSYFSQFSLKEPPSCWKRGELILLIPIYPRIYKKKNSRISLLSPFITPLYLGTAVARRLPGSSFSPRTFTSLCTLRTLSELPRRASALRPSRSSWLLARRSSRRSSSLRLRKETAVLLVN